MRIFVPVGVMSHMVLEQVCNKAEGKSSRVKVRRRSGLRKRARILDLSAGIAEIVHLPMVGFERVRREGAENKAAVGRHAVGGRHQRACKELMRHWAPRRSERRNGGQCNEDSQCHLLTDCGPVNARRPGGRRAALSKMYVTEDRLTGSKVSV